MIERPILKKRHVELVSHQRATDVFGERRMTGDARQITRTRALVRDFPLLAHT